MWIRTQYDKFIEMTGKIMKKEKSIYDEKQPYKIYVSSLNKNEEVELTAEYKTEYECDLVLEIFQQALLTGVPIFSFERKVTTELIKKYAEKYDADLSELDLE